MTIIRNLDKSDNVVEPSTSKELNDSMKRLITVFLKYGCFEVVKVPPTLVKDIFKYILCYY